MPMGRILNPYQRNALTVTLREFEASLRRALGYLDGCRVQGALVQETLRLSDRQQAEMRQDIAEALEQVAALSRELALESSEQDAAGLIRSEMSVAWANLLDVQSKKMRGYGAVHPSLAEKIDPPLARLAKIALKLANYSQEANHTGENHEQY